MKNVGIILGRFQPVHNGHINFIKKACDENELVYVFICSANTVNERNPLPIIIRERLLAVALEEAGLIEKVKIVPLNDLYGEQNNSHSWGFYLYVHIVKEIEQAYCNLYYGDAYGIISTWFPDFLLKEFVTIKLVNRNEDLISSTMVRDRLLNEISLDGLVPPIVIKYKDKLREYLKYFVKA